MTDPAVTAPPTRATFRHLERLRVRWAEVDLQGIVFNGHYLMYIDTAVAGWWRAMAMPYQQTMAGLGGDLYVRKAALTYDASARYDELLDIGVRTARVGNSSLVVEAAVFRGDQRLVGAELIYVYADPSSQTSRPVPPTLRALFQAFEVGEPMVEVRRGGWDELGRDAAEIRSRVFIDEQKIPAEMEWDAADAGCSHAVAYNRLGLPLACGRLLEHAPGVARIGRMAVLSGMRGSRIGRAVLDALLQMARGRGDREAVLHAQTSAAPFYSRAGFVARGGVFDDAGIPHIEMALPL